MQPHQPSIEINGTSNFAKEYDSFRQGLRVFPDVGIYLSPAAEEASAPTIGGQLDECIVSVYPPLNPDHETLVLPDNLIAELGLAATVTRQGATISGADTTAHYQAILRYLRYANRKPAYYLNRAFKLSCSELAGRFTSNEYVQTVTVTHPQIKVDKMADGLGFSNNWNADENVESHKDESSDPRDNPILSGLAPNTAINTDNDNKNKVNHNSEESTAGVHHHPAAVPAHAKISQHHVEMKAPHTANDVLFTSSVLEGAAANSAGNQL